MTSRKLSIFSSTTPVPKLSDPSSIGSPAAISETSRVYPGVFALATLLEVVSISCWLTESPLRAVESVPNNPDMVILRLWLFRGPRPDFCPQQTGSEQAGIGRVGGRASVDHAIQNGETALQVPQQRPVHARQITDPNSERLPLRLQLCRVPDFRGIA